MHYGDASVGNCALGVWMLDEWGGTVARSYTGRCGDGILSGSGLTFGAPGPSSHMARAITTDGAAGQITLPSLNGVGGSGRLVASTDPQTWTVWSYNAADITSASSASWIFGSDTSAYVPMAFGSASGLLTNEVVSVACNNGGVDRRTGWTGFTIPAGWNFHVLAFNGNQNNWFYYLNGALITAPPYSATQINNAGGCLGFDGTQTYTMGVTSVTAFSAITVAGAAVFSHYMGPGEIARLYQAGKNGFAVNTRFRRV